MEKRSYRNFKRREPDLTMEQKIEKFIIRNSGNGFFTKISTIQYKFEISESMTWNIVGQLLTSGLLESTHDDITGEMKLCETDKTYVIMGLERKRKRDKYRENSKIKSNK